MTDESVLHALRTALDADPKNGALWQHYATLLVGAERVDDAIAALRTAGEIESCRDAVSKQLIPLLRETGQLSEALLRAEALLAKEPDSEVQAELDQIKAAQGQGEASREPLLASVTPDTSTPEDWASQFDWGELRVTLDDVAGLKEVKRQLQLRIIAPFTQPEIYQAFGRDAGGGILLYGPPGCGKTYIARATAGELKARFVSISIHEIVDKYWGESEKLIHALFEDARKNSPTVLFFDEFDALGATRGRGESQFWKTLVDQLLQEMDGVDGGNRDVLMFAATNTPWNVDSAFRRPGRFDRVLFVAPPDKEARNAILERHTRKLPGGAAIELDKIVAGTELYTGADLVDLCRRATEHALERSLESGNVSDVIQTDFDAALAAAQSTSLEWLATARNFARYSNEGGQYDELTKFLKDAGRW